MGVRSSRVWNPSVGSMVGPEESELQQLLSADDLQDKLVVQDGQPNLNFAVGQISLQDNTLAAIALIAHVEGRFLVAVPSPLWHRKATNRRLIAGALSKPIHCAVACCRDDDRPTRLVESSVKVWIAFLSDQAEKLVTFQDGAELAFPFTAEDEEDVVPFAPALLEVSQEKFIFLSAESGGGEVGADPVPGEAPGPLPVPAPAEERLLRLETALTDIQANLVQLLSRDAVPGGGPAPKVSAGPSINKSKPKASAKVSFSGLDQTVVDSALAAGIPVDHLSEVSGILKKRPGKLEDLPRKSAVQVPNELSESDEEDEVEEVAATSGSGSGSGESGVARAIVKLTKVCSALARQKTAKKENLEALLDSSGLVGSEGSGSVGSSKRNAAALRALRHCLQSNPEFLFKSIEANLLMDFESRAVRPGTPMGSATIRGWLEARSRIQNYTAHVHWAWQVGGIWDCLIRGQPQDIQEARARCALLVSAADQAAVDGGSWVLANVMLMEAPPPYHLFASHQAPTPLELQHTALVDPRWIELLLSHVKDMDSYQEAKRRLGKPPKPEPQTDPERATPKNKAKAKQQKGNKGAGRGEAHAAETAAE